MATMKDVAEEAGVSVTTVSHVINNTRYVSPELTQKVNQAIEKLDYHPNPLGRGLRKGESNTIALLVSDIANPFFPKVARGVEDCARENDYHVVFCNTDEDPSKEKVYLSLLKAKKMDGFIVAPTSEGKENLIPLVEEGIPLVLIDRPIDTFKVDQVFSDNFEGAYEATKHLIELGHREIGYIAGMSKIRSTEHRLAGYRKALNDYGIEVREDFIVKGNSQVEDSYFAMKSLLRQDYQITAIFASNNLMTIGTMQFLKGSNISCPEEISVVCFDDLEWFTSFTPSLTAVAQKRYEMGYKAAEMLFERIKQKEERIKNIKPMKLKLPPILEVRESTTSVKGSSRFSIQHTGGDII